MPNPSTNLPVATPKIYYSVIATLSILTPTCLIHEKLEVESTSVPHIFFLLGLLLVSLPTHDIAHCLAHSFIFVFQDSTFLKVLNSDFWALLKNEM